MCRDKAIAEYLGTQQKAKQKQDLIKEKLR